ncbi:MAG: hypothetical protein RIC19_12175 [Phaeodactylibacter sp.]|uniref:hypothetical protein n=1 Tax=Phaeodactylibacter sp. TaxID=1940289 RepID=UPI0032EAD114
MKQLFSIIGIDGSGKDYWLQRIMAQVDTKKYWPLPCTAYHHSAHCAQPALSMALQELGIQADQASDAALKGISLFLKMLLFSTELRHLQEQHAAAVVLSTRHPVIDTPVYARLFIQHLRMRPEEKQNIFARAKLYLPSDQWEALSQLISANAQRWDQQPLPEFIKQTAPLGWQAQFDVFTRAFDVPIPQKILFLNPPVATIIERLQQREAAAREMHEQATFIRQLKTYLEQALAALMACQSNLKVYTTDGAADTTEAILPSFLSS